MKTVPLFTRERCHLGEEAHAAPERARARRPFELAVVDLDLSAEAGRRKRRDREVLGVELGGRKIMNHRVDAARLARLLSNDEA